MNHLNQWISQPSVISGGSVTYPRAVIRAVPPYVACPPATTRPGDTCTVVVLRRLSTFLNIYTFKSKGKSGMKGRGR
jgi:hypothetical protein